MSLRGYDPKNYFRATVAPSADDDIDRGYEAGSRWIYNAGSNIYNIYTCVTNVRDAAIWQYEGTGSGSGLPTPGCVWPILTADADGNAVWGLLTFDSSGNIVVDSSGYPVLGAC